MKTAKKVMVGVELYCPHCDAIFVADSGSHYWDVNEIESNKQVECRDCGMPFQLPVVR